MTSWPARRGEGGRGPCRTGRPGGRRRAGPRLHTFFGDLIMPTNFRNTLAGSRANRPRPRRVLRLAQGVIGPEALEGRTVPAVVAAFSPGLGLLTVTGDALDNTVVVSRNAAGAILVN